MGGAEYGRWGARHYHEALGLCLARRDTTTFPRASSPRDYRASPLDRPSRPVVISLVAPRKLADVLSTAPPLCLLLGRQAQAAHALYSGPAAVRESL